MSTTTTPTTTTTETTTQEVEIAVLNFIKTQYEANQPAVLTAIQNAEGGVQAFLVKVITDAPKPSGILGTVYDILEPTLESYVAALITQYGPTIIYQFIDAELADAIAAVSK